MKETVSYSKGSAILIEQPFVYVLHSRLSSERCDHCFEKGNLLTCQGCNLCRYCDRMCQKKGWFYHKRECQNMKRIAPRIFPDAARMLARIIFKLEKGGAREQGFYLPRQFRVFMDLMSHYNEIKNDTKRMEHFHSLYAVLEVFFDGKTVLPNPIELLRIYGKMVVNTFCILDSEMQSIGTGMYLGASIIDHSCSPNAVAVFHGTTLNIRTLIDIPTLDWNRVYISYIDLLRYPEERQRDLQETYYFICQCTRCQDVEELNLMNSFVCQNEQCRKAILGGEKVELKGLEIKCMECSEIISPETWEKIGGVSEFTDEQLVAMKDVTYLDVCRLCLKRQEGLLDAMNLRHVRVLDMAMDSCITLGLWEDAFKYGQKLVAPFKRYYGSLHPITGVLFMKLGKLALYLELLENARTLLQEAAKVLLITHGENHPFVREELYSYMRQCIR